MTWTVIINTSEGHYKFWSYNNIDVVRDVEIHVRWGRISGAFIGTHGQNGYYNLDTVLRRKNEKLNSGYHLFSERHPTGVPSDGEVSGSEREEREEREREIRLLQIRARARENERQEREAQSQPQQTQNRKRITDKFSYNKLKTRHIVPNVEKYKTDSLGYLKSYRSGYNKPSFNRNTKFMRLRDTPENLKNEAKKYYNKLNRSLPFEGLRNPSLPTYYAIFDKKGNNKYECIGIYSLDRIRGYSDFLSIKVKTENRNSMLKHILYRMSVSVDSSIEKIDIKLGTKGKATLKTLKEMASFYIEKTPTSITYKKNDLRSNFNYVEAEVGRWID